jgi:hypothetical protein
VDLYDGLVFPSLSDLLTETRSALFCVVLQCSTGGEGMEFSPQTVGAGIVHRGETDINQLLPLRPSRLTCSLLTLIRMPPFEIFQRTSALSCRWGSAQRSQYIPRSVRWHSVCSSLIDSMQVPTLVHGEICAIPPTSHGAPAIRHH